MPQGLHDGAKSEDGVDKDFARSTGTDDGMLNGVTCNRYYNPGDDLATWQLKPVQTAPFYACKLGRGSLGTKGGIVVNSDAQVLRNGEPVPGLYACGSAADAVISGYTGGGFPNASGVVGSVCAMNHALDLGLF